MDSSDRLQRIRQLALMSDAEISDVASDELEHVAFGYVEGEQEVPLEDIHIMDDYVYQLAIDDVKDPEDWVDSLRYPIDLILERGILFIEDGHHRYVTAQMLDADTILADIVIRDNAIETIRRLGREPHRDGMIRYRGDLYAPEPIQYRGDVYVVAQEPDETTLTPEQQEEIKDAVETNIEATWKAAEKVLQEYRIKPPTRGDSVKEGDGVDLHFGISTNGTPNAILKLDYKLSWFQKGVNTLLSNPAKDAGLLQEVILSFCEANFVANRKEDIHGLLTAISLLQNLPSTAGAGTYVNLPNIDAEDQERIEWLLSHILGMIEDRPDLDVDWESKKSVLVVLEKDRSADRMEEAQFTEAKKILNSFTDDGWKAAVSEMLKKIQQRQQFKPARKDIEKLIQTLTKHEDYSGKYQLTHDPKTNYIAIELEAPYLYRIVVDWNPGVGVTFKEATLTFCKRSYVGRSADEAKALLSAMVDISIAYGEAANEDLSPDKEKKPSKTKEDLVATIMQSILRDPGGWLVGVAGGKVEDESVLAAFDRILAEDPNAVRQMAEQQPEQLKDWFTKNPASIDILRNDQPELHEQIGRDIEMAATDLWDIPAVAQNFNTWVKEEANKMATVAERQESQLLMDRFRENPKTLAWLAKEQPQQYEYLGNQYGVSEEPWWNGKAEVDPKFIEFLEKRPRQFYEVLQNDPKQLNDYLRKNPEAAEYIQSRLPKLEDAMRRNPDLDQMFDSLPLQEAGTPFG